MTYSEKKLVGSVLRTAIDLGESVLLVHPENIAGMLTFSLLGMVIVKSSDSDSDSDLFIGPQRKFVYQLVIQNKFK